MMRARCPWTLALALALAPFLLPTPAHANEMQRIILDAGLNLGLWQAQVAIFDTPVGDPSQIGYANGAFAAVTMVRERLRPPFERIDLDAVLDAITRYPQRTEGLPPRQRAIHVKRIRDLLHGRLSVLYLSTVGIYAGSNCDGAFLDVGYHLGRAQMATFAGDAATLSNARSMLLRAVRTGVSASQTTGCGFNLESVWNDLGIDRATTAADFQELVEPIRSAAQVASARFDRYDPWAPTDPPRDEEPPPGDRDGSIVGTWRFDTGARVVFRAAGGQVLGTLHGLSSTLVSMGYSEGMEGYRLQDTGAGMYTGQKAVRDSDGVFHWKDVRVTIDGDTATFSEMFDGGRARYLAMRER